MPLRLHHFLVALSPLASGGGGAMLQSMALFQIHHCGYNIIDVCLYALHFQFSSMSEHTCHYDMHICADIHKNSCTHKPHTDG